MKSPEVNEYVEGDRCHSHNGLVESQHSVGRWIQWRWYGTHVGGEGGGGDGSGGGSGGCCRPHKHEVDDLTLLTAT